MNQAIHTTTASGIKTLMASHSIWQDGMSKVRGNVRDRVDTAGGWGMEKQSKFLVLMSQTNQIL